MSIHFDRRQLIAGIALGTAALLAAPAFAAPFTSSRISVVTKGSGPDVILIPGLTNGRDVWDGTVKAVPGYRYHLVQVAGFAGEPARGNASGPIVSSVAAEIARYIREEGLKAPAVIGHSMGGIVALMIAARWPERVGKAMAVDILPAPASGFGFSAAGVQPLADALFESLTRTPQGQHTLQSLMGLFGGSAMASSGSDSGVTARALHELATMDLTPELPKIEAPLTVVYAVPADRQDAVAVERLYRQAYASAPHVRLRPVPGSGHMVMYDQPRLFYADVKQFLEN